VRARPRGLAAVAAGAALIGAGFAFGYPELAVLGATALVAACCAIAYVAWRPVLTVERGVDPERVGRGEPCTHTLTVRLRGRLRPATLVAEDRCGGESVAVPLVGLRPGHDTAVDYPVPTGRRGVVEIGPLTVTRVDPLALAGTRRRYGGTAKVWVHPRVHPLTAVPVGIARSLEGRIDRVPHGSITFDMLREYVMGDELRRVHWRTTARVGELMVREYVDTSLPRVVVLLDARARAYPDPERFEDACEAAASVLVAALRADLAAELLVVGDTVEQSTVEDHVAVGPGGARRVDAAPMLDRLAEASLVEASTERGEAALDAAIERLRRYPLGDTLVYLTGSGRPEELAPVGTLRGRYPTIVVAVLGAPAELASSGAGPWAGAAMVEGVRLLAVDDAEGFATAWDGIGQW
jgi:uncharacterized protein (DUF58 family)